jgi:hypothetical protein
VVATHDARVGEFFARVAVPGGVHTVQLARLQPAGVPA